MVESNRSCYNTKVSTAQILARIFKLAIPINFGSLILPLITLIDLAIAPGQLQAAGFTHRSGRLLYMVS